MGSTFQAQTSQRQRRVELGVGLPSGPFDKTNVLPRVGLRPLYALQT